MAEPHASPAHCTPSPSANGSPSSSAKEKSSRKSLSLQRVADPLGKTGAQGHTGGGGVRSAPSRHRQLDFDADSVAEGGEESDNGGEEGASDAQEATQELTEEPEEEAEPDGSSSESEPAGEVAEREEAESSSSSSEDDPADETFVPDSDGNMEEATETESDASSVENAPVKRQARRRTERRGRQSSSARRADPAPSRAQPGGRRQTVRWTQEEVDFLRNGVREHGLGSWKRILLDGQGVFLSHRTNMDLKDKWTNLIKRFGKDALLGETEIDVGVRAATSLSHEKDPQDGAGSSSSSAKRKRMALKIAADSFPEFIDVQVDIERCVDVRALKKRICTKLLPNRWEGDTVPEQIQLISTESRRLLGDDEPLSRCLDEDGCGLYVLAGSP